jgi:FAD/FMN-containing dehydrogenase
VQREAALVPVADMPAAMRVLAAARETFGENVEEFEFMSATSSELVRALRGAAFRWPLAAAPAPFTLLLQVKSHDADDDLAAKLYEFLSERLARPEAEIGYAPLKALKEIRHSITEASGARMRALGGGRLSFDTAAPVAVFGAYLAALEQALKDADTGVQFVAFGHAGVGGAHLHLIGSSDKPVAAHADALVGIVFDVTAQFGGTFSAEHGVGPKWGEEFRHRAPAAIRAALAAAKRFHDPCGILSPRSFGLDRA